MSNSFIKGIFFILILIYILSPADAVPGPIDDLLLMLMAFAVNTNK